MFAINMSMEGKFEVIAGTYEEYLLGYLYDPTNKSLTQSFASHDHSGSIRCLATQGHYLVSGGSDDRIVIYDLKSRKEHCMLTNHNATVSAVALTKNHSHVISSSQDGALAIVRTGNWQLEKFWDKAHKDAQVIDIAVHSSGKLALTLGTDCTIHTWNLVKGREAYIINLRSKCKDAKSLEKIVFAPDGNRFLIYGGKYIEVWSIKVGGALKVLEHNQKVTTCTWINNKILFVGYEDGNIATINLDSDKRISKLAHNSRVKVAQYHDGYLATGSSNGEIKIWSRNLEELAKITTGCRITCLTVANWMANAKNEVKVEENDVQESVAVQRATKSVVVVEESENEDNEVVEVVTKKRKTRTQGMKKKKKIIKNKSL
ncbi:hypothetical protein ABEB36_000575 [Hypothenemus hampei]|uniref:P21-activated protein kinase-interacting protein 1-like n=1 Tax=Hypothenemus hampei TaxID=57062 RepID=A0ABD1FBQ6_HYPHA